VSERRYSYQKLDSLLHAPARLGIATALYAHPDGLTFVELREACELSDGNLSRHLRRMEEEGVVRSTREFVGRIPRTTVSMTAEGRERFERYVEQLRTIVEDDVTAGAASPGRNPRLATNE
jgi:DNA-binding MarR family transcriptional regulator